MCDQFLDKTLAALVKSHAVLSMKKPLARRYSNEIKQSALALYFLSPKTYRHLSRFNDTSWQENIGEANTKSLLQARFR